jgi:hypothetical protein
VLSESNSQAGYPVVLLRRDTVMVAWQERSLAAASADSVAMAKKDRNDPAAYVNAVGALQVMTRTGVLARAADR